MIEKHLNSVFEILSSHSRNGEVGSIALEKMGAKFTTSVDETSVRIALLHYHGSRY